MASTAQPLPAAPSWRPEGYHAITPHINIGAGRAHEAIQWYTKAMGAIVLAEYFKDDADGKPGKSVMHSALRFFDSTVFVNDVFECTSQQQQQQEWGAFTPSSSSFYVYVEDVDAAHKKAVQEGARERLAPKDMFWGDRNAIFMDPFDQQWIIARPIPGFQRQPPPSK